MGLGRPQETVARMWLDPLACRTAQRSGRDEAGRQLRDGPNESRSDRAARLAPFRKRQGRIGRAWSARGPVRGQREGGPARPAAFDLKRNQTEIGLWIR